MNDLDILRDLIKDEALAAIEEDYYQRASEKKIVFLEENSEGHAYTVKVHNVPGNVIAIKADVFKAASSIFKDNKGECKRADYVIIVNAESGNWIIYIEMKKGKPEGGEEIENQLKGAECFVAYCRAIGRSFWGSKDFLDEKDYQQLFVAIVGIGMDKRPTRWKRSSDKLHNTPGNMLRIRAPGNRGLQFNRLIANGKQKP